MIRHFILAAVLALSAAGAAQAANSAKPAPAPVKGAPAAATAKGDWKEGTNYFLVVPAQHTSVPAGKVEVTEVFSYGCPFCAKYNPVIQKMRASLPANAKVTYLPASFSDAEDWPMFQQAYCTAQMLGVADEAHDRMFEAVWTSGDLAIVDPGTNRLKRPLPSIEDAARVYHKLTGVSEAKFIATAKSFAVDVKRKADDALVVAYHVDQTPTIIVNGKYRVTLSSAGGFDQLIQLVGWLVAKETH
jgi:protein dithiol oxidoreductase (disulfide-forming)